MSEPQYKTIDKFDKVIGSLTDLPEVLATQPTTIQEATPFVGDVQQFTVRTFRQPDNKGDVLSLIFVDGDRGAVRLIIPNRVIDAIVRQRESLATRGRRLRGKAAAAARKARGELPAFLNGKGKKKGRAKS